MKVLNIYEDLCECCEGKEFLLENFTILNNAFEFIQYNIININYKYGLDINKQAS